MSFLKNIMLIFMCMSLFAGGIANASMLCCAQTDNSAPMQMDSEQPCHDQTNQDDQNMTGCDGCDCQHCTQISALPPYTEVKNHYSSLAKIFNNQFLYSRELGKVYEPPKTIS